MLQYLADVAGSTTGVEENILLANPISLFCFILYYFNFILLYAYVLLLSCFIVDPKIDSGGIRKCQDIEEQQLKSVWEVGGDPFRQAGSHLWRQNCKLYVFLCGL